MHKGGARVYFSKLFLPTWANAKTVYKAIDLYTTALRVGRFSGVAFHVTQVLFKY